MTTPEYQLLLEAGMLLLGGLGAALLSQIGMVHTGITAQFVLGSLAFAYAAQVNFYAGLLAGYLASFALLVGAFIINAFNPRTYIIVLYLLSLASVQVGNLIMQTFPPPLTLSVVSPRVGWPFDVAGTIYLGLGLCIVTSLSAWLNQRTWQRLLLSHWSQISPATARDLQIAGIFPTARLLRASLPTAALVSACFFGAILLGCFARDGAYISGKFDIVPFWMLLFGLLAKDSLLRLPILVLLFQIDDWLQIEGYPSTHRLQLPTQSLFVFYGLIFVALSLLARKKELAR